MHVCGTVHPENIDEIETRRKALPRTKAFDGGEYVYINCIYFCVTETEEDQVSLERFQGQHITLNNCLNGLNPDFDRVPSSGFYNFAESVGASHIRVLPLLGNQLTEDNIIRIVHPSATSFSGLSDVESFINSNTSYNVPEALVLNIIACPLGDNLLGQAELFSNHCVVRNDTVGSTNTPGPDYLTNYNYGRTTVHEVGHCFGLPHTFTSTGSCPSTPAFADIPSQKNPNFDAFLLENPNWDGKLCNRYRDCNQPTYDIPGSSPPYSCVSNCSTETGEMFMNFMDYGNDLNSICFSNNQNSASRVFVKSGEFALQDGPLDPPSPGDENVPDVPSTEIDHTPIGGNNMSTQTIVLISILSVIFIAIIGIIIALTLKR